MEAVIEAVRLVVSRRSGVTVLCCDCPVLGAILLTHPFYSYKSYSPVDSRLGALAGEAEKLSRRTTWYAEL